MKITSLKNENGARVYHVIDCGCIQEFWTYKEAQQYVSYFLKDSEPVETKTDYCNRMGFDM